MEQQQRQKWAAGIVVAAVLFGPGSAGAAIGLISGGASAASAAGSCGPGGTAAPVANVNLSAEQLANAQIITATIAAAGAPKHAAVVALATAMQESTLHNYTTQVDHDSEGLFQQRVSIYTEQVATNPVLSTQAFLKRLLGVPNWQSLPVTEAAATVQIPREDLRGEYAKWESLATSLADKFWTGPEQGTGVTPQPGGAGAGAGGVGDPAAGLPCPTSGDQGGGAQGGSAVTGQGVPAGYTLPVDPTLATVVGYALAQLGKPYVYAAEGPDSFDCSGLVLAAWSQVGVALPRTTYVQVTVGSPVASASLMTPGDLIFIPGSDGTFEHPGHVGMYIGQVGGVQYLVNAPQTGDVVKVATVSSWGQLAAIRHVTTTSPAGGTS